MNLRITLVDTGAFKGTKTVHNMRMTVDGHTTLFMREELTNGDVVWSVYNKGMYDEQNETNSANLEQMFQDNKPR